ncbi:secretion protein EspK [Mycobacterium spongiae]|uniref:Secretion protein EspK n=1 Tax=Mycobacterium spongiae TaxID=886343 RepID=A0A975K140_9MYCO|nr:secretion protein EspK [Mycobacterium spongiae]QUR69436.1 secretion protein EspK [Mycobacterium spongiae]
MGITRPAGAYAVPMLEPGGWPEANEDTFYDRAQEYIQVLRNVTDVMETCQRQRGEVFEGGIWSGGAASAANGALGANINQMMTLQDYLATVITWHRHIGGLVAQAKADIGNNVDGTHREIMILENDPELDADERNAAIKSLISAAHEANASVVAETAEQVRASRNWKPPKNALEDLLHQKTPPLPEIPTLVVPAPGSPAPGTPTPTPPVPPPTPAHPGTPAEPSPGAPVTPVNPMPVPPLTPGAPGTPGTPAPGQPVIPPVTPGHPGGPITPGRPGGPVRPSKPGKPGKPTPSEPAIPVTPGPAPAPAPGPVPPPAPAPGPAPPPGSTPQPSPAPSPAPHQPATPVHPGTPSTPADPGAPAAPADQPAAQVKPAAATQAPAASGPSSGASSGDDSPPAGAAPAAATGMPAAGRGVTAVPSGAAAGATGAKPSAQPAAGSGAGLRAASGRAPLGSSGSEGSTPTTRAASVRSAPPASPRSPEPTDRPEQTEAGDPVTPTPVVPVSASRASRDAAAAATRRGGKADPLRLARRIAAALNAPDIGDEGDYGFCWITAVTTDGSIVVANSYGLAYLPDGVQLPDKVYMASADHAIPADEMARCATYPLLAVQGWAAFHDLKLRAVIGTAEQLAQSDPGAAKIVLEPDDIPESGKMTGRSRLEVVDPSAAAQLADTSDSRLIELLPPAPADANAPDDERHMLWFELMKPMTSTATGREAAHLRAFRAYALHSQEIALHQAHLATEPEAQRAAVADWLYWRYVAGLLDSALSEAS